MQQKMATVMANQSRPTGSRVGMLTSRVAEVVSLSQLLAEPAQLRNCNN